jgi:hypothetical protein
MAKESENDAITLFQLEAMRLHDADAEMLRQVETKQGHELVAFVCDWWDTRSRQILLEMFDAGRFDVTGFEEVSGHLKAQEQISWRDLPDEWRRQFGVTLDL